MELCSLCKRIKEIRLEQGRPYYNDLCDDCKQKETEKILINMRKRLNAGKIPETAKQSS